MTMLRENTYKRAYNEVRGTLCRAEYRVAQANGGLGQALQQTTGYHCHKESTIVIPLQEVGARLGGGGGGILTGRGVYRVQ